MKPQPESPARPSHAQGSTETPPGWERIVAGHLPEPTFWPAGLGLAITFLFWGFITLWVVFVVGLLLFVCSLVGWILDIRRERNSDHS